MTLSRLSVRLASALLLSSCSCAPDPKAVNTRRITAEVIAAAHAPIDAFNAHGAEKAVSADMPNITVMFHGAPNDEGPAADLATTKSEVAERLRERDTIAAPCPESPQRRSWISLLSGPELSLLGQIQEADVPNVWVGGILRFGSVSKGCP